MNNICQEYYAHGNCFCDGEIDEFTPITYNVRDKILHEVSYFVGGIIALLFSFVSNIGRGNKTVHIYCHILKCYYKYFGSFFAKVRLKSLNI